MISIRVNGGEPIIVTARTAAQLTVFNSMSQALMPESPEFTAVHMLISMLATQIEDAQHRSATVLPFEPREPQPPSAA